MDIYEFAIRMEKDGEQFYRTLAEQTNHKGLKAVFNLLADAEVKHLKVIEKLMLSDTDYSGSSNILKDAKNIFESMDPETVQQFKGTEINLYQKALIIEEKSHDFYTEQAIEVEGEKKREVLLKLAEEEKQHIRLMENLIDLVSRPETWLENAEWYHLDEY